MEKMPFQPEQAAAAWRGGLPVIRGSFVTLREAPTVMAHALWSVLWPSEVAHLFAPTPAHEADFELSLAALTASRAGGSALAFAVETSVPIGLIIVRALEPGFYTAEWAFGFAPQAWATHAPAEALTLVRDFVLESIGAQRIESRTFADSDLRIACLRRLGAIEEGRLRRSARTETGFVDQLLWSIVKSDRVN